MRRYSKFLYDSYNILHSNSSTLLLVNCLTLAMPDHWQTITTELFFIFICIQNETTEPIRISIPYVWQSECCWATLLGSMIKTRIFNNNTIKTFEKVKWSSIMWCWLIIQASINFLSESSIFCWDLFYEVWHGYGWIIDP